MLRHVVGILTIVLFPPQVHNKIHQGLFSKKGLQIALFYYSSHPNCSIVPNVPICLIGVKLLNHIWWKLFFLLMIMKMLEDFPELAKTNVKKLKLGKKKKQMYVLYYYSGDWLVGIYRERSWEQYSTALWCTFCCFQD